MRPAKTPGRSRRRTTALLAMVTGAGTVILGAAPAASAEPTADQLALATLAEIVRGDYPAATAEFNPTMRTLLPAPALAQSWDLYQQAFGAYQSHGAPENIQRGEVTVVTVPLQMTRRPGQFRVSVQPDGTLAALTFLREGVPVP